MRSCCIRLALAVGILLWGAGPGGEHRACAGSCPSYSLTPGVCLDPGHGGSTAGQFHPPNDNGDDFGTCGSLGGTTCLNEVWVNHEIAPLAESALAYVGYATCTKYSMTQYLTAQQRADAANNDPNVDAFISVHHEGLSSVWDTRTFYEYVGSHPAQTWNYALAEALADGIDSRFHYGKSVRPDTQGLYKKMPVLRYASMPATLTEASSLGHVEEAQLMAYDPSHRIAEADGIREGISIFGQRSRPLFFECARLPSPWTGYFRFSWQSVEWADGYLVYVDGGLDYPLCSPTASSQCYDVNAATACTLFTEIPAEPTISVRAYVNTPDGKYVGGFGDCVAYYDGTGCFGTAIDRMISGFMATGGNHLVTLSWHAVSFEDWVEFEIWRSTNGGQSYEDSLGSIDYVPGIDDYVFVDSTAGYWLTYCYKIRDTEGNAWWGPACGRPTSGVVSPPTPSPTPILAVSRLGNGHAHLCLEQGSEYADEYRIYRTGGGPDTSLVLQGEPCLEWTELQNDTTYSFRARAWNTLGGTPYSPYVWAVPMARPASLHSAGGHQCIHVWWAACTSASGYRVYYATDESGPWESWMDAGDTTATTVLGLEDGTQYYLYAVGLDQYGNETDPSYLITETPGCASGTSGSDVTPAEFALGRSFPNPSCSSLSIPYDLPAPCTRVSLVIYDARGREVRRFLDQAQQPGRYEVVWDGRDGQGSVAPPGVYFCRLEAGAFKRSNKMLWVK